MEILYSDNKVEQICHSLKAAQKFFGGDRSLALSLLDRIQELSMAPTLKEILCSGNSMRFHNLHNSGKRNLDGFFAVDVKTRKQPWRIILQPLDDDKTPFEVCNIDVIARYVRIVEIMEISKHYE